MSRLKSQINRKLQGLRVQMFKWSIFIALMAFSNTCLAKIDIDLACKEKKEQQHSLLERLSTSLTEAHLAGQCTGFKSVYRINLKEACSEFLEQKASLLSSLSTSLKEANLAGMCVGAIYKLAKECEADTYNIDYTDIARGSITVEIVEQRLGCYGNTYGW